MKSQRPAIVWFRRDLRLADNPALAAAVRQAASIVPVFIWSPQKDGETAPGAASCWWLRQSLSALADSLERLGSRLIIRLGPSLPALRDVLRATRADAVFWNRRYEPEVVKRDRAIESALREDGVRVETFNGALLFEPDAVTNQQGRPFKVFSAYWRACSKLPRAVKRTRPPRQILEPEAWPASVSLDELGFEPRIDWAGGLRTAWRPGERGADQQLRRFLKEAFANYPADRDRPDRVGTSRLSPHIHFGEISPAQLWHAVQSRLAKGPSEAAGAAAETYSRELGWREFAHHLLTHFPQTVSEPLRPQFARFPWRHDRDGLRAWQRGRTGYPIVDAGMRELWTTGWMHNRVRMIVGSFLVKHLLINWREGAAWFWDTLVDADLANNTLGWQWIAGCGADAAPYFRIFNPVLQGRKFDPNGDYVRRWVPELTKLDDKWIHAPWDAPAAVLFEAGVELGASYPPPIIDHVLARRRALRALATIRGRVDVG